jgi:hypothetical protein
MFDPPTQRYPKKWKEMSLDYKLMFVDHGGMMVVFIAGRIPNVPRVLPAQPASGLEYF